SPAVVRSSTAMAQRTPKKPACFRSSLEARVVTALRKAGKASLQRPCSARVMAFSGVIVAAGLLGDVFCSWASTRAVPDARIARFAARNFPRIFLVIKKEGAGGGVFACPILLHRGTSSKTSVQIGCSVGLVHS